MTNSGETQSRRERLTAAAWAAAALVLNTLILLASLWCALFGPAKGVLLGVLGFLVGFAGGVLTLAGGDRTRGNKPSHRPAARPLLDPGPGGLAARAPALAALRGPLTAATALPALAAAVCLLLMFAVMRGDGVPEGPAAESHVFAQRPAYRLNNHGQYTIVSRLRYVAAGASFMIGWHSMALVISLMALRRLLYGKGDGGL